VVDALGARWSGISEVSYVPRQERLVGHARGDHARSVADVDFGQQNETILMLAKQRGPHSRTGVLFRLDSSFLEQSVRCLCPEICPQDALTPGKI
jgi:hypothetical protein